jgi:hypothetical protein
MGGLQQSVPHQLGLGSALWHVCVLLLPVPCLVAPPISVKQQQQQQSSVPVTASARQRPSLPPGSSWCSRVVTGGLLPTLWGYRWPVLSTEDSMFWAEPTWFWLPDTICRQHMHSSCIRLWPGMQSQCSSLDMPGVVRADDARQNHTISYAVWLLREMSRVSNCRGQETSVAACTSLPG